MKDKFLVYLAGPIMLTECCGYRAYNIEEAIIMVKALLLPVPHR
jgi:hypothetical protein